nr:hypothetical protein [uncultured Pseudodesulfovibrio sp.]
MSACSPHKLYPVPPTGWVLYCQKKPADPGCEDYTYLANLNEMVNGNIEYEPEPIGQEEWVSLPNGGYGDCDVCGLGASIDGTFIRFAEIVFAYDEGTPKVKQVYKLL